MQASVFQLPRCSLRFPFSTISAFSFGKSTCTRKEIADGAFFLASRRCTAGSHVQSLRSDGSRKGHSPRSKSASNRATPDEEQEDSSSSDGKSSDSSNQESIIALFRRIQSSIAKEGSSHTQRRASKTQRGNMPVDTVLEGLNQHPRKMQVKGKGVKRQVDRIIPLRKTSARKDVSMEDVDLPKGNFRSSRPVSSFIKRLPIPAAVKETVNRETIERSSFSVEKDNILELQTLKKMKIPELKELAKTKGLKGYSKLKKIELVELLKGLPQS